MKKYYPFNICEKHKGKSKYNTLFLLYYFKWINNKKIKEKLLKINVIKFKKYNKKSSVPYALKDFTSEEKKGIIKGLGFFQLSFGCSRGCVFCGADAPYFREPISIPFFQVKYILKEYNYFIQKNSTFLYWASEPTDYLYKSKNYIDVVKEYRKQVGYFPFTSTGLSQKNLKIFSKIENIKTRVSKLSSDRRVIEENNIDITNYNSNKEILYNGLNGYRNKKYNYGIGCLSGTLITPFGTYNMVNIRKCNDYFPQGVLVYPITKITRKDHIDIGTNLINYLDTYIVLYDYNEVRLLYYIPKKGVVFLYNLNKIFMVIYDREDIHMGVVKILKVFEVSNEEYENLVYTRKGQNILSQIEKNE